MSAVAVTPGSEWRRSPAVARWLSIVPGLGQVYYGAPKRALQYLLGVLVPAGILAAVFVPPVFGAAGNVTVQFNAVIFQLLSALPLHPLLRLTLLFVSELVELSLLVVAVSFWIAASWDARQGTIARNEARDHAPTWWYVKLKRFLFDDPDEERTHV